MIRWIATLTLTLTLSACAEASHDDTAEPCFADSSTGMAAVSVTDIACDYWDGDNVVTIYTFETAPIDLQVLGCTLDTDGGETCHEFQWSLNGLRVVSPVSVACVDTDRFLLTWTPAR